MSPGTYPGKEGDVSLRRVLGSRCGVFRRKGATRRPAATVTVETELPSCDVTSRV